MLNADKVARFGANAYDVAQFGHDFIEDPQMALTNLATSQLIGRTVGHLGQRFQLIGLVKQQMLIWEAERRLPIKVASRNA